MESPITLGNFDTRRSQFRRKALRRIKSAKINNELKLIK